MTFHNVVFPTNLVLVNGGVPELVFYEFVSTDNITMND